jgi:hypothetical protein
MAEVPCNPQLQCESNAREMADLEVVLKKGRLLVLTLSSHSHHCKSKRRRTTASSDGQAVGSGQSLHPTERERKQ